MRASPGRGTPRNVTDPRTLLRLRTEHEKLRSCPAGAEAAIVTATVHRDVGVLTGVDGAVVGSDRLATITQDWSEYRSQVACQPDAGVTEVMVSQMLALKRRVNDETA